MYSIHLFLLFVSTLVMYDVQDSHNSSDLHLGFYTISRNSLLIPERRKSSLLFMVNCASWDESSEEQRWNERREEKPRWTLPNGFKHNRSDLKAKLEKFYSLMMECSWRRNNSVLSRRRLNVNKPRLNDPAWPYLTETFRSLSIFGLSKSGKSRKSIKRKTLGHVRYINSF